MDNCRGRHKYWYYVYDNNGLGLALTQESFNEGFEKIEEPVSEAKVQTVEKIRVITDYFRDKFGSIAEEDYQHVKKAIQQAIAQREAEIVGMLEEKKEKEITHERKRCDLCKSRIIFNETITTAQNLIQQSHD